MKKYVVIIICVVLVAALVFIFYDSSKQEKPEPTQKSDATSDSSPESSGEPMGDPTSDPKAIPSSIPSSGPSQESTAEPSMAPDATHTVAPMPSPTATSETTPRPSSSSTPGTETTVAPKNTPTPKPTATPTPKPTATPTPKPTATPTPKPTATPTPKPTATPTPKPTATPTPKPTATPTPKPTPTPTNSKAPSPTSTPVPGSGIQGIGMTDYSDYGFQVDSNGTILLNGKAYYGYGVNWHGGFNRSLYASNRKEINSLETYFKSLSDNNIPYVRMMMGVFYAYQVPSYVDDYDRFIKCMDRIVNLAEKYNVGIVASLMWNESAFYQYCGEDLKMLGNKDAGGTKLAVKYVTDIVSRYRYSPAIWAWEIGNEGNLGVDLWPEHGVQHSTAQLTSYYQIIGEAIRKQDPYRMICGGDSAPRPGAYRLRHFHRWNYANEVDTLAEMKETLLCYTPSPLDTVSLHIYEYGDADRMATMVRAAKDLKIGLYVGEFGAGSFTAAGDPASEVDCWNYVVDNILNSD